MKISRGGSSFGVGRTAQAKTKATQKKGFVDKVEGTAPVATPDAIAPLEKADAPIFDAMSAASQQYQSGEATLEEATHAVVSSVIREHFGKKNLPPHDIETITTAVTTSIGADDSLRSRLEETLRRITTEKNRS